jgi:hypothetical protein
VLPCKAVPKLYAWHEWQRPFRDAEAHEANEGPRVLDFYRPVAPAAFDQFRGPNVNASVTRLAGLRRGVLSSKVCGMVTMVFAENFVKYRNHLHPGESRL